MSGCPGQADASRGDSQQQVDDGRDKPVFADVKQSGPTIIPSSSIDVLLEPYLFADSIREVHETLELMPELGEHLWAHRVVGPAAAGLSIADTTIGQDLEVITRRRLRHLPAEAVVFVVTDDTCASVAGDWCPKVNLLATFDHAQAWQQASGTDGSIVDVASAATDAGRTWRPLFA